MALEAVAVSLEAAGGPPPPPPQPPPPPPPNPHGRVPVIRRKIRQFM
jgi:hypothetical protein